MTTQDIANKLVDFCRKGEYQECYQELYDPNVVSVEPKGAMLERAEGLAALAEKGKKWNEMVEEFHGSTVGDPIVAGNHFSCTMMLDCTMKGAGRQKMEEVCVYTVNNGKVVEERFFYDVSGQ